MNLVIPIVDLVGNGTQYQIEELPPWLGGGEAIVVDAMDIDKVRTNSLELYEMLLPSGGTVAQRKITQEERDKVQSVAAGVEERVAPAKKRTTRKGRTTRKKPAARKRSTRAFKRSMLPCRVAGCSWKKETTVQGRRMHERRMHGK